MSKKKNRDENEKIEEAVEEIPVEASAEETAETEEGSEEEATVALTKAEFVELHKSLEEAKQREQENLESWQRERADFSNYKKRIERDQETAKNNYKIDVLKKFIPILDDLELAYQHRPEGGEAAAWAKGIELIIRKFNSVLENDGLTKIEVKAGDKLDPNIHMAVSYEDNDEFGSEEIIEVLKNGYRMGDRVIDPAVVRVAR